MEVAGPLGTPLGLAHGINFLRAIQSQPAIFLSGDLPVTQRQAVTGEHEQKTSGVSQENHAASDLLSGPAASHFSPRSLDTTHSVFQASESQDALPLATRMD